MKKKDLSTHVLEIAKKLELILAVSLIIGILLGSMGVIKYLSQLLQGNYGVIGDLLSYVLILVIGIEFIQIIALRSSKAMLDIVAFAVAKKMLVNGQTMMDIVIAIIAIGIVLLIRKHLVKDDYVTLGDGNYIVPATSKLDSINCSTGFRIPINKANTIEGLIYQLSRESRIPIGEGVEYWLGNVKFQILQMDNGRIDQVLVGEIQANINYGRTG